MLPIIWLIAALSGLKMAGHKACAVALLITMTLAVGFWKSDPLSAVTAVLEGTLNALWPICLVIIAALFTYNLMMRTGAMELVKKMLMGELSTLGWPVSVRLSPYRLRCWWESG